MPSLHARCRAISCCDLTEKRARTALALALDTRSEAEGKVVMRTLSCILAAFIGLSGCAHSVKDIARASSRAAVDESVDELTAEDSKAQMAEAVEDPRFERALAAITDHITEGVLRSLESDRAHRQIEEIASIMTKSVSKQMMETLGSPDTRKNVELLTAAMTQSFVRNLGQTLRDDFVPGMGSALQSDLSRGAAAGLQGPLQNALGVTAQNVAYNAVLGANHGLRSTWLGETGALGGMRDLAREGAPLLQLAFWALALLALTVVSAAAIVISRTRRARTEVQRLESATLLLATAMRERHATDETDEIVTVVRDALEKSAQDHKRHGLLGALRMRHH